MLKDNSLNPDEQKHQKIIYQAPFGVAEIDEAGILLGLNKIGSAWIAEILHTSTVAGDNFFEVLQELAPLIVTKIKNFSEDEGIIALNETYPYQDRYFSFTSSKIQPGCIMIRFDDISEKHTREAALYQSELDRIVDQNKFEMATNVLHDIGNAVVGFGSYLTRIRRLLEHNNLKRLEQLILFFEQQQASLKEALGEEKAKAVLEMVTGITNTRKASQDEMRSCITEQLKIITHIQEILQIQRQYVSGKDTHERKPLSFRSIVNDSLCMLFASFDKREIEVCIDIPEGLPMIEGDRTKLMQVMLNVLKNSMEAIDRNSQNTTKKITIQLTTMEPDLLVLTVTDSGIGFNEDTANQLFSRGFTTRQTGTGLGLDHCRSIIEAHHGTMTLTSEGVGKGAVTEIRFTI